MASIANDTLVSQTSPVFLVQIWQCSCLGIKNGTVVQETVESVRSSVCVCPDAWWSLAEQTR